MKKILILGSSGQDGYYLTRNLISRGYFIVGTGLRQVHSLESSDFFNYHSLDLREPSLLKAFLFHERPDAIVHLAAINSHSGESYEPIFSDMFKVNVESLYVALEYVRCSGENIPVMFAGSCKVFPQPLTGTVDESTLRKSSCLYSLTKNSAYDLVDYYRDNHGVTASILTFFNHESRRRPNGFFMSKLAAIVAAEMTGFHSSEIFEDLNFYCDWGCAEEYMDICADIFEKSVGEDFVIGSGNTHSGIDFVKNIFDKYDIDRTRYIKPNSNPENLSHSPYRVSVEKLNKHLARRPRVPIEKVLGDMIKSKLDNGIAAGTLD